MFGDGIGMERKEEFDIQVISSFVPYWWRMIRRMMLTAQTLVDVSVPKMIVGCQEGKGGDLHKSHAEDACKYEFLGLTGSKAP